MARKLKIGFDQGPPTLVAQTGKYGILKPQQTTLVRGSGTITPTARVWVPGHWLDTGSGTINTATVKPNIVGAMIRKPWNTLEPGVPGVYTLSAIGTQLNLAASLGIYLIVMIETKSFNNTQYAPPYLVPYSTIYTNSLGATGYGMWRWDSHVYLAYQPLVQAVGDYVATLPNKAWFAGIATQETATQVTADDPTYTPQRYITALGLESDYITAGCLKGRGYHYVNQLPGNGSGNLLPTYSAKVRNNGGVWGFPDLTMGNSGLNNNVYTWVLATHNAGGATFSSVQNAEYQPKPPADNRTMLNLFKFSTAQIPNDFGALGSAIGNPIHNDMIFWTPHQSGARNYDPEAVTVIGNNPAPFGTVTPIDP